MADELFQIESIRPVVSLPVDKATEQDIPVSVFFSHAILIGKDPEKDVLRNVCKQEKIKILMTHAEKPFLRSKLIHPTLQDAVFASSKKDWERIKTLAEGIDYYHSDQFYKPAWFAINTDKLPLPLPAHPVIHILGLYSENGIIQPVKDRNSIIFIELQTKERNEKQGEAAELNLYEWLLRKKITNLRGM